MSNQIKFIRNMSQEKFDYELHKALVGDGYLTMCYKLKANILELPIDMFYEYSREGKKWLIKYPVFINEQLNKVDEVMIKPRIEMIRKEMEKRYLSDGAFKEYFPVEDKRQ